VGLLHSQAQVRDTVICAAQFPMLYLILSILTNAAIYLLFKFYERWKVNVFNVIVVNYTVASITGFLLVPDYAAIDLKAAEIDWATPALLLGFVFIGIFVLMANSAQKVGVSVTTVASKMSLALSVVLLVSFGNGELSTTEIVALFLAVVGVIFVSIRKSKSLFKWKYFFLPLVIFVGSAVIDFGIAQLSTYPRNDSETALFTCLSFAGAGCLGYCIVALKVFAGKFRFSKADAMAGAVLGVVNFGTIFFLVHAYDAQLMERSTLLPINNMGVVIVNAMASLLLFSEKLSVWNWVGVSVSIGSILLLAI